jgi:hypothetical protein
VNVSSCSVRYLTIFVFSSNATVLQKYELHEFKPLVESIRTGDLGTFHDGLVKYQDLFIR